MLALKAMWDKPKGDNPRDTEKVEVVVREFMAIAVSDTSGNRPVAVIQEPDGKLRYVELKFLEIREEIHVR